MMPGFIKTARFATCLGIAAGSIAAGRAADLSPAIVYDFGGKADRSFNQSAAEGVARFTKETGIACREFEISNQAQRTQIMRQFVRHGANIIAAIGFNQASAVEEVAKESPNVKFVIVDGVVDLPNVESITFKEQESSFLCGIAAALDSKTGKIGFVGGMDIPLIRKFALGYRSGAKYANPRIEVFENMTGSTPAAWNDPARGAELAMSQFGRGADVIFHAAGGTGIGVMQSAKDNGFLAIGCDSNQDYIQPGTVLTSAVKRVDVAVYTAFMDALHGRWHAGHTALGLAEGGVDYSLDQFNRGILTPAIEQRLDQAKADIIAGRIQVPEYKE
jgi:basic membrane protein A